MNRCEFKKTPQFGAAAGEAGPGRSSPGIKAQGALQEVSPIFGS